MARTSCCYATQPLKAVGLPRWDESQWDELFSSFGTGGEMNEAGIRQEAAAINARKETVYQLQIVLETHLAEAARGVIRALYESIQCDDSSSPSE